MPRTGTYNDNANRSYPFVSLGDVRGEYALTSLVTELLIPNSTIVDFGCVFGLGAGYDPQTHRIWLHRVERAGSIFYFDFRTNVPALSGYSLTFTRAVTDLEYSHEYAEADTAVSSSSATPDPACPRTDPLWEGFLVTGDLADLTMLLPADDILWAEDTDDMVIEPGRIENLDKGFIRSINLANSPRLFSPFTDACSSISSTSENTEYTVNARCITGAIKIKEGFNCSIAQQTSSQSLTINAAVGAGEGEVCEEVPRYDGETPQAGSNLLSGGPSCNDIIKSINGLQGPRVNIRGGTGVSINPDPDEDHKLLIAVDFSQMLYCPTISSSSSSSSIGGA